MIPAEKRGSARSSRASFPPGWDDHERGIETTEITKDGDVVHANTIHLGEDILHGHIHKMHSQLTLHPEELEQHPVPVSSSPDGPIFTSNHYQRRSQIVREVRDMVSGTRQGVDTRHLRVCFDAFAT